MFDDFGGPGFDWNGNGKNDLFDNYMDMKVSCGDKDAAGNRKKRSGGIVIYDSRKDSDGVAIFKLLLVCVFCTGGMILPASVDAGPLGAAICMLGALVLSFAVLKL